MDTAAIGVAQKEDEEQGVDEEYIFYRMVFSRVLPLWVAFWGRLRLC